MTHEYLAIAVTAAALIHLAVVSRVQGVLTLDGIFVISQWILAFGTLLILNPDDPRDGAYALVVSIPMLIYVGTSLIICLTPSAPISSSIRRAGPQIIYIPPSKRLWFLAGFALFVTIAYFYAVGYNVFLLGLRNLASGSPYDAASLRLDSYAGNRYLFPGYVAQFKNVILPSLSVVVICYMFHLRRGGRWSTAVILVGVSLVGVLGTGQRGAFVQLALTVLTFLYYIDRRRFKRRALITLAFVVPILVLATLVLGRSAHQIAGVAASNDRLSILFDEVIKRFFFDNQSAGQGAFWYTQRLESPLGMDWLRSMYALLPGVSDPGPNIAQEVFAMLYRSRRGTAPPSMWGSVAYNFGWPGLLMLPALLAILFQAITRRVISKAELTPLAAIGMSGVCVIGGTWVAGGPDYLVNAGLVTFAVLWWAGLRQHRRFAACSADSKLRPAVVACERHLGTRTNPAYSLAATSAGEEVVKSGPKAI